MEPILSELEPIAGVSLATFVSVSLELSRVAFDGSRSPEIAADLGIGADAWVVASAGWSERLRTSPGVAHEFSRIYRRGWGSR